MSLPSVSNTKIFSNVLEEGHILTFGIFPEHVPYIHVFIAGVELIPIGNLKIRSTTSRDTATPISRPVYMISRSFNPNPVIDARPR